MIIEAKLFIYSEKGWETLVELIESKNDQRLLNEITIYKLYSSANYPPLPDTMRDYAVVTLSKRAENVIEEFGGDTEIKEINLLCQEIKNQNRTPVFGNNENSKYLNCK